MRSAPAAAKPVTFHYKQELDPTGVAPSYDAAKIRRRVWSRESGTPKKIISVEAGGRLKHRRIPSRNIFKDLKKNLTRFGVSESVTLINGYSCQETTISAIQQMLGRGEVGLFIFDADSNVRRDLDCYGDLLSEDCWFVIDDYFGPGAKAAPLRAQVDAFAAAGRLLPFGYYGCGVFGSDSGSGNDQVFEGAIAEKFGMTAKCFQ